MVVAIGFDVKAHDDGAKMFLVGGRRNSANPHQARRQTDNDCRVTTKIKRYITVTSNFDKKFKNPATEKRLFKKEVNSWRGIAAASSFSR